MNYSDIVSNVEIFGLESAVRGSKFPMAIDLNAIDGEVVDRTYKLAAAKVGSGHDNFLNGIIIQFDLTFTNKVWVEAERYHFLDFISSQSTMHRITRFDLDQAYIEYVDPRMVDIMKEKVAQYRAFEEEIKQAKLNGENDPVKNEQLKRMYLEILYSNPAGFRLTARMTTNYRQLKTIYHQRRFHRLPEWQIFCHWLETLPYSEFITKGN